MLPLYYSRKISAAGANFLLLEFSESTNNSCPHAAHEGFGNESPSDALNSPWSRLRSENVCGCLVAAVRCEFRDRRKAVVRWHQSAYRYPIAAKNCFRE